jgi:hypothetical protein
MSSADNEAKLSVEEALQLVELAEVGSKLKNLDDIPERVLAGAARLAGSPSALMYLADSRLSAPRFLSFGFEPKSRGEIERMCALQWGLLSDREVAGPIRFGAPDASRLASSILYPLRDGGHTMGFLGLAPPANAVGEVPLFIDRLIGLLSNAVDLLLDRVKYERQLTHLNTYLTVSSMLAQPLGLNELLETILYSCVDAASAEEASVLLLDDEKRCFRFYQVEGPSKPILLGATFPADKGVAGSVLRNQQSEVVNDAQKDPRFYGKIDSDTGFKTRNMIAVPLTAGEERIGVLEVLNKADGGRFTEEEHSLLLAIAEEIAFAIRNAKVFEYVVNSYCKQRQGQASCKGCKRPLGSWTPCVKYREGVV